MSGTHVDSRMIAHRLFALFVGSSCIAIGVTLFAALRSRPLDHGFVTVGVAAVMMLYFTVGLLLFTLFFFRRFTSTPPQSFSGPNVAPTDLWDEQLDGIPAGVTFENNAPTEDRRRIVAKGSVRLARGLLCWPDASTNRADHLAFRELVEKLRGVNQLGTDITLIDLGATDLRGADLSGANLSKADLRGARLRQADFRESDLTETVLRGADLAKADFRRADLSRADLSNAVLREAILRWVDLTGADLTGADLFGANLEGADLREAILRGANLGLASLNVNTCDEADLSEADLRGADIRGAKLVRARGLI